LETTETAHYRCDFVPGAIPVNGTISIEERMIDGVLGVHFYGTIQSGDGGFTDGKHGFHVHSSGDPSSKILNNSIKIIIILKIFLYILCFLFSTCKNTFFIKFFS
jgi:hypothetical protein